MKKTVFFALFIGLIVVAAAISVQAADCFWLDGTLYCAREQVVIVQQPCIQPQQVVYVQPASPIYGGNYYGGGYSQASWSYRSKHFRASFSEGRRW